jgi:hypothetical protein
MTTRRTWWGIIAVTVGLVGLAPTGRAAPPGDAGLVDLVPVRGAVLPTGDFVGTLRIVACTVDAAGRLRLTGVLTGSASPRGGARMPVREQPFTAAATLHDPGRTTDVLRLALAPIALHPAGVRIRLAPITVDIETLPRVGEELAARLPPP